MRRQELNAHWRAERNFMLYKIYCLKDQDGEIRYVGYTSLSEARRMAEHRHSHPHRRSYSFHVLDVFESKAEALEAERAYIKALHPAENIAPGQGFPESLACGRAVSHAKMSKPVYCPDLDRRFTSVNAAAEEMSSNRNHVKDCCYGRRQTTNGLHFVFLDPNT